MNKTQNEIDRIFIKDENKHKLLYAKLEDVSQGVLFDFISEIGLYNLMRYCCNNNNHELVKKLIECGADVNIRNEYGFTPLMNACLNSLPESAELLIKLGADANQKNIFGDTALAIAKRKSTGKRIVDLLIQNGAYE